jgi:hypothetical protein
VLVSVWTWRFESSSGHHKSQLNNCNYYIKIIFVPVKPSHRTIFWTTLPIYDEMGSVLSFDMITN